MTVAKVEPCHTVLVMGMVCPIKCRIMYMHYICKSIYSDQKTHYMTKPVTITMATTIADVPSFAMEILLVVYHAASTR